MNRLPNSATTANTCSPGPNPFREPTRLSPTVTTVPSNEADDGEPSRPTRQEQEPASDAVSELAEGLYRLQLPVSMPGLGHVNCYALEDDRGLTLVDPGLPDQGTWEALGRHLVQLDARFDHVHTVVATHSHPDHYGGVHRLRAEHGA